MMTAPTVVPAVEVYAGDTLLFPSYTLADENGVPLDLSTWTLVAKWRRTLPSTAAVTLTVDSSAAATGVVGLSATAEQTRAMNGSGVWDLRGTLGATVRTFLRGTTTWVQDVSRD